MNQDFKIAAPCGLICDECLWHNGKKEVTCPGCHISEGKPFWGECEVYQCAKMKKFEHCGTCNDFPCETIINQFDPNIPNGEIEAIFRIGQLAIRTKIGTKEWLKKRSKGKLPNFEKLKKE